MLSIIRFSCALAVAVMASGCISNVARKNAKLEPGFDVDISGGVSGAFEGIDEDGDETSTETLGFAEIDFQYAVVNQDQSGFAVQLKVPWTVIYSAIDFYYQLAPLGPRTYAGFGAELSAQPGVYGVITQYLSDVVYASFTGRVLMISGRDDNDDTEALINPQLSLGVDGGEIDLSLFLSYGRATGDGYDLGVSFFGDADDFRKNVYLGGVSARF